MLTRMPRFGAANLASLIAAFAALDPLEPVAVPTFAESPRRVKSIGRFLAGGEALGCIKCHTFKGIESEGVQAVDMTVMTRRLRRDWFHRYLVDTQAYRPGTRMPTGWPGRQDDAAAGRRRRHPEADRGDLGVPLRRLQRRRALRAGTRADAAGARDTRRSSTATSSREPDRGRSASAIPSR